jgi:hypothetical protein
MGNLYVGLDRGARPGFGREPEHCGERLSSQGLAGPWGKWNRYWGKFSCVLCSRNGALCHQLLCRCSRVLIDLFEGLVTANGLNLMHAASGLCETCAA